MLLGIFILILFFLSPVYGDGFDDGGDSSLNEFYQTVGIGIYEYSNDVYYDSTEIYGEDFSTLVGNSLPSLTGLNYLHRAPYIADRVYVPPGTSIALVYFYYNNTGHDVEISEILVPFSRNHIDMGNWLNISTPQFSAPEYTVVNVNFDNRNLRKEGYMGRYGGPGVVPAGDSGYMVLDIMVVDNPLEIISIDTEVEGNEFEMTVGLRNRSLEKLDDLVFKHEDFEKVLDLEASEETSLAYSLPKKENMGHFEIYNPNIKQESVLWGNRYYNWIDTDAVTVIGYRNDGGWFNGAYVQPELESMVIERIPYTMYSEDLMYENVVNDVNIVYEEEVKGESNYQLNLLPFTAKIYR